MVIISGPGSLYVRPEPRCPTHGQMKRRVACDPAPDGGTVVEAWTCAGFDGEGCDHVRLGSDVPWTYLGESDGIELSLS